MPDNAALAAADLAAYLTRIGYDGPVAPTRAVLDRLHLLHPQSIPFENLNPFAGLAPRLDLASIVEKLVRSKRGGYCFEHSTLFRAALATFGFQATPLAARVLMGQPEDRQTAQTHKLLRLTCEGEDLIADVGFGGMTLTGPIRLEPNLEQPTPHEPYRLMQTGEDWWLHAKVAGEWRLLYRFTLRPPWPIDEEVSNHYVATHPSSAFTNTLRVARILPRGRLALLNRRLTEHRLGETSLVQDIADDTALRAVLAERFGIEEKDELWAKAVAGIA
jgi:N-hydroxyarylamine O-acetyltransferase